MRPAKKARLLRMRARSMVVMRDLLHILNSSTFRLESGEGTFMASPVISVTFPVATVTFSVISVTRVAL